jgi:hypothetical protein
LDFFNFLLFNEYKWVLTSFVMKQIFFITAVIGLLVTAMPVSAVIVFQDNFEAGAASNATSLNGSGTTPDVLTYTAGNTSRQYNSTLWVDTTQGYGADRQGLIDGGTGGTDLGNFTPDGAGPQAYTFRYTNSGLTSNVGTIGTLTVGQTITVSFDVVIDGWNSGAAYNVSLVTFNGAARGDVRSNAGETSTLANVSGNATSSFQTINSLSYTVDGTESVIGHDIALRFYGQTSAAIIDNVSVDIQLIPEPSVFALSMFGFGALWLLRRHSR